MASLGPREKSLTSQVSETSGSGLPPPPTTYTFPLNSAQLCWTRGLCREGFEIQMSLQRFNGALVIHWIKKTLLDSSAIFLPVCNC